MAPKSSRPSCPPELPAAQNVCITEANTRPIQDKAELRIPDQGVLIHAAAVAEGVAVEEDIARHRPSVNAGKEIPAETGHRRKVRRARQAGLDARRPVVVGKISAVTHGHACIGIGEHIPQGAPHVGREIQRCPGQG